MEIMVGVLLVLLIWGVALFNMLVRLRNHCREAWAGIETELKRRYDLVPNLVETVKGYARHEASLFERVTEARTRAIASEGSPGSQASDENQLVESLKRLLLVVENYPELKANRHFLELQKELSNTEDRIQAARRFYNANVRDFNTRIEVFPSNLVAGLFGFKQEEFFEIQSAVERAAPDVRMP